MKRRNSTFTSNSKQTDMLDIYKYKYISSDLCEAYNRTGNFEGPFFRLSSDRQKLLVDPTPVEKFVSQLST